MIVKVIQKDDGKYGSVQYFEGNYLYTKLTPFDTMGSSETITIVSSKTNELPKKVWNLIIDNGSNRSHIQTNCKVFIMNNDGKTVDRLN